MVRKSGRLVPSLTFGVLALGSLAAVAAASEFLHRPACPEQIAVAARGEPGFVAFAGADVAPCVRRRHRH